MRWKRGICAAVACGDSGVMGLEPSAAAHALVADIQHEQKNAALLGRAATMVHGSSVWYRKKPSDNKSGSELRGSQERTHLLIQCTGQGVWGSFTLQVLWLQREGSLGVEIHESALHAVRPELLGRQNLCIALHGALYSSRLFTQWVQGATDATSGQKGL